MDATALRLVGEVAIKRFEHRRNHHDEEDEQQERERVSLSERRAVRLHELHVQGMRLRQAMR
jgi:hypothetical protein